MPKLFFIRHGQTEANVKGILTGTIETDLTQKGIEDAKKLANKLKEEFNYYYCSPLKRTQQTLYAMKGDVKFIVDSRLIEVFSGDWQGKLKSELPEKEYTLYKKCSLTPPNGESLRDIYKRIESFLEEMFTKYKKNDKILIITHNAFMRNLRSLFIEEDRGYEPNNLEIFEIDDDMYNQMRNKNWAF